MESTGEIQIENDAEPDIEQVKKNWELERLKQLKEEEERKAEQEEEDLVYTYTKTEVRKSTRPVKSRPVSCEIKEKLIDPRPTTTKKDKKESLVKEKKVIDIKPLSPVKDEIVETKRPSKRGRKPKQKCDQSPSPASVPEPVPKPIPTEKPKVLTLSPNVQSAAKPILKTIITRPAIPIKNIFNIPTTLNRPQSNQQPIILKSNNVINVPVTVTSPNKLIFRTVVQKPSSVLSSTCLSPSPSSSNSSSQSK